MASNDTERPAKSELQAVLKGHKWTVSGVDFHPAGNMVVTGSWDRTIRIWDAADGKELRRLDRNQHIAPITSVKWHPNGALVASTSADNTTALWDAATGKKMRTLREHFGWVLDCSFAPDRTKFATASWDKTVRLWDPNTGELLSTLRGHTKGVWGCAFYPAGHTSALLASCGEDCTARLWDTRTRKVALTLSGGHADAVYHVAWSNDGGLIATASSDHVVTIWDPKAGKILRQLKGHGNTVKKVVFSPQEQENGVTCLASAGGFSCNLWNPKINSHNLVEEMKIHAEGQEIECVDISANGSFVATGARDGTVKISKIPYIPLIRHIDVPSNRSHQEWRSTQHGEEPKDPEWSVIARKRRETLRTALEGGKPQSKTKNANSLERTAEETSFPRGTRNSFKPAQPQEIKPVEVVKSTQYTKNSGMLLNSNSPQRPIAKKIGNLGTFMADQKSKTDATLEDVADFTDMPRNTKVAEPRRPVSVMDLMSSDVPEVVHKRKIKLRQFSVNDARPAKPDDAFANM
eukprot:m.71468 g.71468  ORF g.71468 m.71468 type:complete len:520 (-) comp24352_c1_seq1:209-1768(-)